MTILIGHCPTCDTPLPLCMCKHHLPSTLGCYAWGVVEIRKDWVRLWRRTGYHQLESMYLAAPKGLKLNVWSRYGVLDVD